jgi:hypothetical protein
MPTNKSIFIEMKKPPEYQHGTETSAARGGNSCPERLGSLVDESVRAIRNQLYTVEPISAMERGDAGLH